MKNQIIVGIFDTASEAQKAVQQLSAAGFERDFVDMSQAMPGTGPSSNTSTTAAKDTISGFFSSFFGGDNHATRTYADVTRSGHSVVTVHVDTAEQAHKVVAMLDSAGAIGVNSKGAKYALQTNYTAGHDDRKPAGQDNSKRNHDESKRAQAAQDKADGMTAKVTEEKLVGKHTEQTGGGREQTIHETVRNPEVDVEQLPGRPTSGRATSAGRPGQE